MIAGIEKDSRAVQHRAALDRRHLSLAANSWQWTYIQAIPAGLKDLSRKLYCIYTLHFDVRRGFAVTYQQWTFPTRYGSSLIQSQAVKSCFCWFADRSQEKLTMSFTVLFQIFSFLYLRRLKRSVLYFHRSWAKSTPLGWLKLNQLRTIKPMSNRISGFSASKM